MSLTVMMILIAENCEDIKSNGGVALLVRVLQSDDAEVIKAQVAGVLMNCTAQGFFHLDLRIWVVTDHSRR
jgi:hypothetical protein